MYVLSHSSHAQAKSAYIYFLKFEDVCMHRYAYLYTHIHIYVCIYSYMYGQVYVHSDLSYATDKHLSIAAVWQCCAHLSEPNLVKLYRVIVIAAAAPHCWVGWGCKLYVCWYHVGVWL